MTPRFRTPSCTVAAGRLRPLAFICSFFLSVILAFAAPAKFDIPAQPAPAALQLFMKQSGASVMYSADQLGKVRTAEVKGELEPLAALQQLLAGTDFNVRQEGPTQFVIEPVSTKPGSVEGSVQSESGRPVAGARVSMVGSNQTVLTDKRGRFAFDEVPAGPQSLAITAEGMQNTKVTEVNVKAGHRLTLSTIAIPATVAGAVHLEDYVVSAQKNDGVVELTPYEVSESKPKPFSTAMCSSRMSSHLLGRFDHGRVGGQAGADQERVQAAIERLGVKYCEAPAGSALFFHGNTFHSSEANLSEKPRRAYICCYNALSNVPYGGKGHGKPVPITMAPDDAILRFAEAVSANT